MVRVRFLERILRLLIKGVFSSVEFAFVFLNFNGGELAKISLESILRQSLIATSEILIVDNGSSDNSDLFLKSVAEKNYNIHFFKLNNLGYAGGINFGINKTNADLVAIVTSDVILAENWAETLSNALLRHSAAAIFCPDIREKKGGTINALRSLIRKLDNQTYEVSILYGAAFLGDRKKLLEVGLFDKTYFMYYEEYDLCWRLRKRGNKVIFAKNTHQFHFGGYSQIATQTKLNLIRKNRLKTIIKNSDPLFFIISLFLISINDLILILSFTITGHWSCLKKLIKADLYAYKEILCHRKSILSKRRIEQKQMKFSDFELGYFQIKNLLEILNIRKNI